MKILPISRIHALTALLLAACFLASCGGGGSDSSGTSQPINTEQPFSLCASNMTPTEIVARINAVRSQGRNCGTTAYAATTPLSWNSKLANAAGNHSTDMANNNYFDHTGLNGSTPATRANAAGYNYTYVGENIAAGYADFDSVINGWLGSSGHCANLMNPNYKEIGMACAKNTGSTYGLYWTQVFGSP